MRRSHSLRRASRLLYRILVVASFAACVAITLSAARAEDWPTYRHDIARSGITSEKLELPLTECWVFQPRRGPEPAWDPPKPQPVEGILELPRVHFDDTFHVAAAGDALYFGSSSENKVCSLDISTGRVRWTKQVGGPVRLAPTVWNDRVFFGADDGFAYCLNASDGSEAWKFHAAPHDDKVLGHGKMISLWPLRTGVLVDEGVAYFGAGIFPMEGVFLYAVRAEDGESIWKNDTCGETHQSAVSPQGYLLASKASLFVPMGRTSPAGFDRKDGRIQYTSYLGKTVGGTYALLNEDYVFTGAGEMMAYEQKSRARFAWYRGRQLLVTKDTSYMLNGTELIALDRTTYPKTSLKRDGITRKQIKLNNPLRVAKTKCSKLKAQIMRSEETLPSLETQIEDLTRSGEAQQVALLKAQQSQIARNLEGDRRALDAAQKDLAQLMQQKDTMAKELKEADEAIAACFQWRIPCDCSDSMILAGDLLFAGGQDKVVAVDAVAGRALWSSKVHGKANGLAAASGRLFVSTDTGAIHCFGSEGALASGSITEPTSSEPFPRNELTPIYEAAADSIVQRTGIQRGYCLMLGCDTGQLAYELARRTDLVIYAVEPDRQKAEAARKALEAAGMYGSRISVEQRPYGKIPYSDYFANLIVSESALLFGEMPGDAEEALRMLKPLGGVICIGQPAEASGKVPPLTADVLRSWLADAGMHPGQISEEQGVWLKYEHGPLEGAGSWTHEYASPSNTACSDDQLVKCPLGVLWFGRPGPTKIVNRHRRAPSPLAIDGRLFVPGEEMIMAYDSYNGLKLWEREIPGARRELVALDCSNLAASHDGLFAAVNDSCLRLDPATGETKQTYRLPPMEGEGPGIWGLVACVDNTLYGTRTQTGKLCDAVFALDIATGDPRWTYVGKQISQSGIAIGDGVLFLVDRAVTNEERQEALNQRISRAAELIGVDRVKAEAELKAADVRMVLALDAFTGKTIWKRPVDLTGCGGGPHWQALAAIYAKDVLLLFGVYTDGHFWQEFFAGEFEFRKIVALSARTGETLWAKNIGYRVRPLVIGETLHAEPWAYDLRTGEQKMRTHPVTGRQEPWQFARPGHHCGCPAACPQTMFFRSGTLGYYDLVGDYGTMHFGGQRPGCWINFIPANGLLLFPEGSAGCMCPFPNQCSYAFKHREVNRAWAQYSAVGDLKPVKHWAINLGAPGDRRDERGVLWFGYPRTGGSLVLRFDLDVRGLPNSPGYFKRNSDTIEVQGTESPWLYASGFLGLSRCVIPLLSEEDGDSLYTVRMCFADLANDEPGARVFDIKLQGKAVCKNFDIAKETGGMNKAIVKEFNAIRVKDDLQIELLSKVRKPDAAQMPILQALEIVREKVLGVGCVAPSFLLSNSEPEQGGVVRMANYTQNDFNGTLQADAPDGFRITPRQSQIRLGYGERATVTLTAALAEPMPPGKYDVAIRLVREDGNVECERRAEIVHLANRGRVVVKAAEDAHVAQSVPDTNQGSQTSLNIDGGNVRMGDESHHLAYLKFLLDVPGKPVSATLRLYNAGNPSGDSGRVCLVTAPWSEKEITYNTRPPLERELARIGAVAENQVVELLLDVNPSGMTEISLAIDPTSCDGVTYVSREGGKPAELIVEFEPNNPLEGMPGRGPARRTGDKEDRRP